MNGLVSNLRNDLPQALQLLEQMVMMESPSFDKPLVDAFARFVAGRFSDLGGRAEIIPAGRFGDQVLVRFGAAATQPILLLGRSTTMAGGTPLPHTLPVSMTGGLPCQVLVSPDVILPLPLPTTTPPPWVVTVAIPASPSLVGFTFHAQWLTVTERTYMGQPQWVRVVTSQAGTAVIGP